MRGGEMAVGTRADAKQLHTWLPAEVSSVLNAHAHEKTISRAAMARQVIADWANANPVQARQTRLNLGAALGPTGYDDPDDDPTNEEVA